MRVISLFTGCGGLDLGFHNAGFEIVFANDNDKAVWETYKNNFNIEMDGRSITEIGSNELPDAEGMIGGPPCQSWSLAGKMLGVKDKRGRLFYEYVRILKDKKPLFFVAENVPGIISSTHIKEFNSILKEFELAGYNVSYKLLDARDYGVPQERRRVVVVGYRKDIGVKFEFPRATHSGVKVLYNTKRWVSLKEAIGDLPEALPGQLKNYPNPGLKVSNNEYMIGSFSTIYMSRNRLKSWDSQSFTIQAGGRHAPLHPSSTKMKKVSKNRWVFDSEKPKYRRLSVREAARVQTFPDSFIFYYKNIADGYKMVGNAVPVKLAEAIASKIYDDLKIKAQNKVSRSKRLRAIAISSRKR
jgi:DNA (cytosine-5)-methyltransferase 1